MEKPAGAEHPINELMRQRWSPRAFTPRPIPRADILTLLEAARWAASSYNQQPWHFLVATRDDEERFAQMLDCLVPGNQEWACNASLLILTVTKQTFDHNGKPNSCAVHDIGLTACQLVLQATALGLATHQMAGIEPDKIRARYGVPDGFDPVTGIAVGYAGDPDSLSGELREMELAPRTRRPFGEFIFADRWGESAGY